MVNQLDHVVHHERHLMMAPRSATLREIRRLAYTQHVETNRRDTYACMRCGTQRQFGASIR